MPGWEAAIGHRGSTIVRRVGRWEGGRGWGGVEVGCRHTAGIVLVKYCTSKAYRRQNFSTTDLGDRLLQSHKLKVFAIVILLLLVGYQRHSITSQRSHFLFLWHAPTVIDVYAMVR
jgi:hypothetical protein